MRILVTSGATREPIDQVRFITNFSTGGTGARIAEAFARAGNEVMCLAGQGAEAPSEPRCEVLRFGSFDDLDSKLRALLAERSWDWVIHLAAVGDYSVREVRTASGQALPRDSAKIDSGDDLTIELRRNFKIVSRLREYARQHPEGSGVRIVAFKLTNRASAGERERAVAKLLAEDVDRVVHNDLAELMRGERVFRIHARGGRAPVEAGSPAELVRMLLLEGDGR